MTQDKPDSEDTRQNIRLRPNVSLKLPPHSDDKIQKKNTSASDKLLLDANRETGMLSSVADLPELIPYTEPLT